MKKVFIALVSLTLAMEISSCGDKKPAVINTTTENTDGAQWCNAVSDSTPNYNAPLDTITQRDSTPFYPGPALLPRIIPGQPYNVAITFKVPQHVYGTPVGDVYVDSLHFVSICNLPQGLCWKVDRANASYGKGDYGVLQISGTTTAASGQYSLNMYVQAFLTGSHAWETTQPASAAGLSMDLIVADSTGVNPTYIAHNPNAFYSECSANQ